MTFGPGLPIKKKFNFGWTIPFHSLWSLLSFTNKLVVYCTVNVNLFGKDAFLIFHKSKSLDISLNSYKFQDTFFDVIESLDSQGMDKALQSMGRLTNPQLAQQCNLYEQELRKEDAALDSDSSSLGGGAPNGIHQQNVVKMR
jgi:hypothetical protein